jgi:hypothetical protein
MPYLGFSAKNDITINATSDLELTSDNTTIKFGADDDVTITHDPDDGLIFKSIATADDNPFLLTIQTGETDLAANDVIGKIQFQAPDEGTGTDANLVSAAIQAVAEGDFSSSSNATSLQFMTGSSEAATTKMTILSSGNVEISNGLDVGTITTSTLASLRLKTAGSNNAVALNIEENSGNEGWGIGVNADGDLKFYNSGTGTSTGISAVTFSDDGKVGIGGIPTAGSFHIFGTSTTDQVIIENTNTGGSSAPDLVLFRKSTSSAADGDVLGRIDFRGLNDANEEINYATIFSTLADASDGTENGKLTIQQRIGSSYVESFTLNEDGNVGIGTTSPTVLLDLESANPIIRLTDSDASGTPECQISGAGGDLILDADRDDEKASTLISFKVDGTEQAQINNAGDLILKSENKLQLNRSDNNRSMKLYTDNSAGFIQTTTDPIIIDAASGRIRFDIASSEKMRLDSSGNLLVGTTASTAYNNSSDVYGFNVYANGQIASSVNAAQAAYFNRQNSDGTIVDLRKDGSSIGTIGTNAGYVKISSGNSSFGSGIEFHNLKSIPVGANGAASDGTVNLGDTDRRWNNIYLAGGAYIGGTGSANYLDDYEEGTWTPLVRGSSTAGTASYSTQIGRYTKIGNLIHVNFVLEYSISSAAGNLEVTGFPFAGSGSEPNDVGVLQHNQAGASYASGVASYVPYMSSAVMSFRGNKSDGTSFVSLAIQNMSYMRVTFVYTQG